MIHELEKTAPCCRGIWSYLTLTSKVHPARKDFDQLIKILDRVLGMGCKAIKEIYDE